MAGGAVMDVPEIKVRSKAFDSLQKASPHTLVHRYADQPLG
jgi:hypothetical protein